ncbi:butyrophilin subfamily 3 member A2-like isoform X5 [Scleropages formosus]|uniref:butyrophilin subfamily 3 member A2-like isoform X5 n=1 Tax=Scleropages formosus TaxID=113540 RepID=UPI0010FAC14D|nr:butyrophilin subfamily 3 member A2-like isoform X5 [Scleropages formosus]
MKWDPYECQCLFLLLFHHILVSTTERFEVLGPSEPVVAVAGEDVVLPCYLKPNISAADLEVRWFRKDFTGSVHLYREHQDQHESQIPNYRGRTSLFSEELKKGNASLKLTGVRTSDFGEYECFVQAPYWYDDRSIDVIIKAVGTQPVISIEGYKEGGISLVCESKGWFPQPQVVWMDSEGHNLTAGPTETQRDSRDLFTVRRRAIVLEGNSNSFTCRIIQQLVNEIKEVSTNIPGEIFQSAHTRKVVLAVFISLAVAVGSGILIFYFVKLHRKKGQLNKQKDELNQQHDELKEQYDELKKQYDELKEQYEKLKLEKDELKQESATDELCKKASDEPPNENEPLKQSEPPNENKLLKEKRAGCVIS